MNVTLIDAWIADNEPNGLTNFCAAAEISPGLLYKIRHRGHSPSFEIAKKIAKVLGVSLDELANATVAA